MNITRLARKILRLGNNHPINLVPGKSAPKSLGCGFYFTTPGGKLVRYPNAYGWPTVFSFIREKKS